MDIEQRAHDLAMFALDLNVKERQKQEDFDFNLVPAYHAAYTNALNELYEYSDLK